MQIFSLLSLLDANITPERTKIHLATFNGEEHPLDVYLAGRFDEWQRWQTRRNFDREFVLSLIDIRATNQWLFAGVHLSAEPAPKPDGGEYRYPLVELASCAELNGRLVAHFERPGRQAYLNGEAWAENLRMSEIKPIKLSIREFPGFRNVDLTLDELQLITSQSIASWRSALSSVAGIYLISDAESGKLYVGQACGEGGIWQRWVAYAGTGHGGNVELKQLLQSEGASRASSFRFSILEIADIHESDQDINGREAHWKRVLLSRDHGLNSN